MGTSTSVGQLAAKIEAAAAALESAERDAVNDAALAGKGILLVNMGVTRMRNVGRSGARLGVRYDIKGGVIPTALLRVTGPAHLLNNPTSAHRIEPRGRTRTATGRRRSGKQALTIGGRPVAYADHPGTSGKRFFERSTPQIAIAAKRALENATSTALRRVF